jgi:hypothetical protein
VKYSARAEFACFVCFYIRVHLVIPSIVVELCSDAQVRVEPVEYQRASLESCTASTICGREVLGGDMNDSFESAKTFYKAETQQQDKSRKAVVDAPSGERLQEDMLVSSIAAKVLSRISRLLEDSGAAEHVYCGMHFRHAAVIHLVMFVFLV